MGERHVKMKAEMGGMLLQTKEPKVASNHQQPGERPGTASPSRPLEGTDPADTCILDFQLPGP